jgi:hypothetical protein
MREIGSLVEHLTALLEDSAFEQELVILPRVGAPNDEGPEPSVCDYCFEALGDHAGTDAHLVMRPWALDCLNVEGPHLCIEEGSLIVIGTLAFARMLILLSSAHLGADVREVDKDKGGAHHQLLVAKVAGNHKGVEGAGERLELDLLFEEQAVEDVSEAQGSGKFGWLH